MEERRQTSFSVLGRIFLTHRLVESPSPALSHTYAPDQVVNFMSAFTQRYLCSKLVDVARVTVRRPYLRTLPSWNRHEFGKRDLAYVE